MKNFIIKKRPYSYNNWNARKKADYQTAIRNSLNIYLPNYTLETSKLYIVIYHFFKRDARLDADNISKPMCDSLCGILFNDDNQIVYRAAASINLTDDMLTEIDFTGIDGTFIADMLNAVETEEHTIYVECGTHDKSLLKFNLEQICR